MTSSARALKAQAYKSKASAFDDTKASVMGDYIPAKLSFDEGESLKTLVPTTDYSGYIVFFFENGKAAKVPLKSYETKTNRKKLSNAYSSKSSPGLVVNNLYNFVFLGK